MYNHVKKTEQALLANLGFGNPATYGVVQHGCGRGAPADVEVSVLRDTNDGSVRVNASWSYYTLDLPCEYYANVRAVNADLSALAVAIKKAVKAKCHVVNGSSVDARRVA